MTDVEKTVQLQEESNKLLMEIRGRYEALEKDRITKGDYDTFVGKINTRFAEIDKALADLNKPDLRGGNRTEGEKQMADFRGWLQKSREMALAVLAGAQGAPEQKVLTVADTTHAGVLAPYQYQNEIIKNATIFSPLRSYARIVNTDKYAVEFPTETAVGTPSAIAESGSTSEDTAWLFALTEIKTFEARFLYKATQKMLEDSAFNLEAEIANYYSRRFGVWEGTQFISGDGTTEPEGVLTNSAVLALAKTTAGSNVIAVDDLLSVQYGLPSPYVPGAIWLMKRVTVGTLMGLKNATTSSYLLQPEIQKGYPYQLLGSPIIECPDMPSGLVDNQYEIVYGDFKQGYCIVDRLDLNIQRLIELYAANGMIGFLGRKRVGGGVLLSEAFVPLKIKA